MWRSDSKEQTIFSIIIADRQAKLNSILTEWKTGNVAEAYTI